MNSKLVLLIASLTIASFVTSAAAQAFGYNITVITGGKPGFYDYEGKTKIYLEGNGFSHKIYLSSGQERLRPGMAYYYYAAAPYNIFQITSVSFDWSKNPFNLMYKIKVDKIIVDPAYIQDWNMRRSNIRGFCSASRPQEVQAGKPQKFWIMC